MVQEHDSRVVIRAAAGHLEHELPIHVSRLRKKSEKQTPRGLKLA